VFSAVLGDAPAPLPPTVPERLGAIIARCLQKDPARRYQRAADVRDALRSMAPHDAVAPVARRRFVRQVGLAVAAVAAMALLAAGLNIDALRAPAPDAPAAPAFDSLAVLPLEDLSGAGQDYFAAGMHDALIVGLGKLDGLRRVIARPSVLRYTRVDRPLAQIAAELGVQVLMTGAVLQSGNRVRVTAQLVDPATERQLWAESYERDLRDVLTLQNEIVAAIARQVQLQISPAGTARRARQVNPESYQAYLKGVFQLNTMTAEGFEKGMALLREAVTLDPTDPLAYAGLSRGYSLAEVFSPETAVDDAARATAAALKALELDPELAEAHAALATARFAKEWDYRAAEESFRDALRLNPNLAEARISYAQYLSIFGEEAEAIAEWQRGVQLDPLSPQYAAWFAGAWWEFGRVDEALAQAQRALDIQPDFLPALFVQGLALLDRGRQDEAVAVHERMVAKYPRQGITWVLARTYALAGRPAEARRLLDRIETTPTVDLLRPWSIAAAYTALGERDTAVQWLERAYEQRLGFVLNAGRERGVGFDLRPLRSHPRFQALLKKLNLTRTGRSAG
jgi:TolB-like protein/Tfp pilus assembly protein PilF